MPDGWGRRLEELLAGPLPGRPAQERMIGRVVPMPEVLPADARDSAVLLFLQDGPEGPEVLLIERTADGGAHSGQMALPGGRWEPEDGSLQQTALREAHEEVGLVPDEVALLGALTPLYIPVSRFMVHPYVGAATGRTVLVPSPSEVVRTVWVPLRTLFHPGSRIETTVRPSSAPGLTMQVPAYQLADATIVWGATAMILSELQVVLEAGDGTRGTAF